MLLALMFSDRPGRSGRKRQMPRTIRSIWTPAWLASYNLDTLSSVGTELSVDLGLGYEFVYRFRVGLAVPIDDSTRSASVYLAAGVAF